MNPAWLNAALVAQYLILMMAYLWTGQTTKALYWAGAAMIGTSVLMMK